MISDSGLLFWATLYMIMKQLSRRNCRWIIVGRHDDELLTWWGRHTECGTYPASLKVEGEMSEEDRIWSAFAAGRWLDNNIHLYS